MAGHFKWLPVLLLALSTFSVSSDLLASIDCGSSKNTTDTYSIDWTSDDTLISNGETRVVQPSYSKSTVMDSLRVFTSRKKNCYSTSVTQGDKVLVRASFYYGNYDQLSTPPTFDLHFDGNFWTTVQTSLSGPTTYEVTYVTKRDSVSVCVAQSKPGQFPFISALEVRSVDSEAYSLVDDNRALFLMRRDAFGASDIIRYPSDSYDRIWLPRSAATGNIIVQNNATFINTTISDNPPLEILQNAVESSSTASIINLATVEPSNYVNMNFTEVTSLNSTQTRSFRVYQSTNTSTPLSPSILPTYGEVLEFSFRNYSDVSFTNFFLIADTASDLPPLISAIEEFNISGVLTNGTNSNDVETLGLLQRTFDVLEDWRGDPCLPAPYSWDWLNCSDEASPRITALYLDDFNLSGELPDISAMDALQIIDLHNNSLSGTIPDFLGTLPKLQQLNLADNQLTGAIPTSLSENKNLNLTITGNPSLCTSGKSCSTSPVDSSLDSGSSTNYISAR